MASTEVGGWFDQRLAGAQVGDPQAFDDLVRLLAAPLVGFLRARGAEDPEDMANEVLVRVFRGIGRFDGNAPQFRAWVFRIARNVLIDERRYRARRPNALPTPDGELDVDSCEMPSPVDQRARIEALLARVTPEQREVLVLRIVADLSVEETAAVIGRRPGAVRALQHRALTRLRAVLSGSAERA